MSKLSAFVQRLLIRHRLCRRQSHGLGRLAFMEIVGDGIADPVVYVVVYTIQCE
jgi:hypothetical protein